MDQHVTSLIDFWKNFKDEESNVPPSEVANCSVTQSFNNSTVHGSEPACNVPPSNTFSWEAQPQYSNVHAQTVDDTSDKENIPNISYNLTPYQQHGNVQQNGFCIQATQGAASSNGYILSRVAPEMNELTHQLAENIPQTAEYGIPLQIMQQIPNGTLATPKNDSSSIPQLSATIPPELAEDLLQKEESSIPDETSKETLGSRSPAKNSISHPRPRGRPPGKVQFGIDDTRTCSFCDRSFCHKSYLTQHMNVHHSGPKKELCRTCGKCFQLREQLEKHLLQHQEDHKTFPCERCPKKFSHKQDLTRHHRHAHLGESVRCQFCDKTFQRTDHKRIHELTRCKENAATKTKTELQDK